MKFQTFRHYCIIVFTCPPHVTLVLCLIVDKLKLKLESKQIGLDTE